MIPNRGLLLIVCLIFCACAKDPQVPVIIESTQSDDEPLARRAWNRAIGKLHRADSALHGPSGMTRNHLKTYFGADTPQARQRVATVLRRMIRKSSEVCYTLRIEDDARIRAGSSSYPFKENEGLAGRTLKGGSPVILLNRRFLRGNPHGMPSVLLHELSHNAAQTRDIGYYRGGAYRMGLDPVTLDESQLLENADTYAEFVDQF